MWLAGRRPPGSTAAVAWREAADALLPSRSSSLRRLAKAAGGPSEEAEMLPRWEGPGLGWQRLLPLGVPGAAAPRPSGLDGRWGESLKGESLRSSLRSCSSPIGNASTKLELPSR